MMDGATPLDVPVFERMAASSQAALDLLLRPLCRRRGLPCRIARIFQPSGRSWRRRLPTGVDTGLTDPDTGEPVVATLDRSRPGIHQALLDPATAGRFPLAIHLAFEGQWAQVVQVLPGSTGDGGDWLAMSEIIMCSEAWARFDPAEVERLGAGSYALSMQRAERHRASGTLRGACRQASYRPTMPHPSSPTCGFCGSPPTATRRTRQPT